MSTTTSTSHVNRHSLLRSVALGGMIIGVTQLIIQEWFVFSVLSNSPFITVMQYIASGVLGNAAFDGGIGTALLGVLFHFFISFVIAGVFILSADRIPLLGRYAIPGALVYGFGVFIVLNFIVIPLSKAPPTSFNNYSASAHRDDYRTHRGHRVDVRNNRAAQCQPQ
jgi:hypothetical protein